MDRGAWRARVHGVGQTQLSNKHSTAAGTSQRGYLMDNTYIKKCSTQHQRNETTMKFCLKKPPNAGKNEENLEFSYITSGRVN